MKTILCALDFSAVSAVVLRYSHALARKHSARLLLVHIVDALPIVAPAITSEYEQAVGAARKRLEDMTHNLSAAGAEIVVEVGDSALELIELAASLKADLVVLGTHGRSGLDKLLMGSTAEEVLSAADCPVITIGPEVTLPQEPSIRRVLLPLDFSPQSLAAIDLAVAVAQQWDAQLFLLHVLERTSETDEPAAKERLRSALPVSVAVRPDLRIASGEPAAGILGVARELSANLIVLGLRHSLDLSRVGTHLARTVAQKVLREAPCPVLTVIARQSASETQR